MIASVRGRQSFVELQRHGRRATAGAIKITKLADATNVPRLAFATSRAVGSAVERNRLRRRLRVVFTDLAAQRPELVPPGDYLLAIRRARFSNEEAKQWLVTALETLASDQ